jgi:effector-binding domain-containing protein
MMKVYIGYECYYDKGDIWKTVAKVFDDEVKALIWEEDFEETEDNWRTIVEMVVE